MQRQSHPVAWIVVGTLAVLCAIMAGAIVVITNNSRQPITILPLGQGKIEKDRDYWAITEAGYDLVASASMVIFWSGPDSRHLQDDFDRPDDGRAVLRDTCRIRADGFERMQLMARQDFLRIHQMDSKNWREEFNKRFPERELIFDEVKLEIRTICADQATGIAMALSKRFDARDQVAYRAYRAEYFKKMAPVLYEEALAKIKKLPSIVGLRKKVLGG
jgi:hypothetical protein